jgi:hypothetical protein
MKKTFHSSIPILTLAVAVAMPLASSAWTFHYVSVSGAGNRDGTDPDNAFAGIQTAINVATNGDDVIFVAAGVYPPIVSSNQTVQILGDPAATTIIDGGGTNRCATLIADDADTGGKTALAYFTLRNGDVMSNYMAQEYEDCGGGARGGYLVDCVVENCTARYGGGVADATTERCIIRNCTAELGGGAHCGPLSTNYHYNTIFEKNHARQMVSAASAWKQNAIMLFNCTVVANTTDNSELPGSVANGYLLNTLFYMNSGDGVRENENEPNPRFVNYWAGDYRLRADSPYIDAGNHYYQYIGYLDNTDFLGDTRVQDGDGDGYAYIDYGVYETVIQGIVVTARAGDGGLVSPATSIIDSGGSVTLAADTNAYGRTVASWSTNGVVVASATNSTLTLTNILSHTDVTVAFNLLDWHVDAGNGNDDNTGDSWAAALKTIQAAIDRAVSGETIYVKPGTYGAIDVDGKRLAFTGVNGAGTTFINANKASRAVTLCDGAAITGFTICNGDLIKLSTLDSQGGGVWGGTIRDCVISNNVSVYGGGAAGATVDRCVVVGNMASEGGGLYECKVFNSLLYKNDALQGGGCKWGTATGCTIVNNRAVLNSATDSTILRNCILTSHGTERRKENLDAFLLGQENASGNLRPTIGFPGGGGFYSHICSLERELTGNGSIAANPRFVDAFNGDYRLRASSPCLDAGSGDYVKPQYNKDLAGNDRVTGSAPDMGCFEGGVVGHVVSVRVEGDGVVSRRTAVVADGGSVSVTATPPAGRAFLGWEANGEPAGASTTITLSGIASDIVLVATFETKTIHVTTSGNDANDGFSQGKPKKTIQAAVNAARNGDTVLVGDGTYSGKVSTIGKSITLQSVNGPDATTITSTWYDDLSRTTVVLGQSYAEPQSLLDGFTVTGGNAVSIRNWGGGVRYGRVQNCIIRNNYGWVGGGVAMAILSNCKLLENEALVAGGGGIFLSVENCLIADNEVDSTFLEVLLGDNVRAPLMGVGGGLAGASANYCTIVGNTTKTYGGGIAGGSAENSIIDGNSADLGNDNVYQLNFHSHLCVPDGSVTGNGSISNAPAFVNAAGGDYSLQSSSPCIDAADYFRSHFNQDLAGNRRVSGPATDMGCYEYQSNRPYDIWASDNGIYGLSEESSDGVANLFRFATDTASGPLTVPLLAIAQPAGGDVVVSHPAFVNPIQTQVQATEDLTDWSETALVPTIESPANSGQWMANDGKDHAQLFFRLKAKELP